MARRGHRFWDQPPAAEKLVADETALLQLLSRWRAEATKAGHAIDRIAVPYEAGWDGFWLGRWPRGPSGWRGLEYEKVHLHANARSSRPRPIRRLVGFYEAERHHQSPGSHAAADIPERPVQMWTIGVAERLRFRRFASELNKPGNARLRPHTHSRHRKAR